MKINNFKKVIKSISIFLFILLLNLNLSFAQDNAKGVSQNFKETADNLTNNVLTSAGTLLMTAAFVVFFYGVVIFIYQRAMGKDGNDLKKGKEFMVWGLIALFVMVSVWGIIKLAQGLLDVESNEIKIQPVKFAALDTGGGGGPGGDTNVLRNPSGANEEDGNGFNNVRLGVKTSGQACTGQPGSSSECVTGLFCRNINTGQSVAEGKPGICSQAPASQTSSRKTPEGRTLILPGDTVAVNVLSSLVSGLKKYGCFPSDVQSMGTVYDANIDAIYVKAFQKANGLVVDGKVGDDTWDKLQTVVGGTKSCQTCNSSTYCGVGYTCKSGNGTVQARNIGVTGVCIAN